MKKLYEILAIESLKKTAFHKIFNETLVAFAKKDHLFTASEKTLKMFAEEDSNDNGVAEQHDMTTTVHDKLKYFLGFAAPYLDTMFQKEVSNQKAVGSLQLGNTTIANVPATFMLGLVNRLEMLRKVIDDIPTHPSGYEWVDDPDHKFAPHVVKIKTPRQSSKGRKIIVPFILAQATKEHKAQVEKLTEEKSVGTYTTMHWSSKFSPKEKSDLLGRIDSLIEHVNVQRQRANDIEAAEVHIGDAIVEYLMPVEVK